MRMSSRDNSNSFLFMQRVFIKDSEKQKGFRYGSPSYVEKCNYYYGKIPSSSYATPTLSIATMKAAVRMSVMLCFSIASRIS